jgi:hypothetical protein
MPTRAVAVSTLGDVLRLVEYAFSALGDGTTILIGEGYLSTFGTGSPPRVLFIPEKTGALVTAPKIGAGYLAGYAHGCDVYVRAAESGTDPGRFDAVYALLSRVTNALKWCDPGHIELSSRLRDTSPLPVDAYGADVAFSFVYTRGIATDPAVLKIPITSVSPPNPDQPGGSTGLTYDVTSASDDPTRP